MNIQSVPFYNTVTPNYGLQDECLQDLKEKGLKDRRSELARHAYRPEGYEKSLQVVYLTLVDESHSPLTVEEERVLQTAKKVNGFADYWLNKVFAATAGILLIAGVVTIFASFYDTKEAAIESSIGALCAALIVQIGTYYFTGIVPHEASEASNERQDIVDELEEKFQEFAFELLLVASKNNEGVKIAEKCDIGLIKQRLQDYLRYDEVNKILDPFEDAVRTVLCSLAPAGPLLNCGYRILKLEREGMKNGLKGWQQDPSIKKVADEIRDVLSSRSKDLSRRHCPVSNRSIENLSYYALQGSDSSAFTETEEEVLVEAQKIDTFIKSWLKTVHYLTAFLQGASGISLIVSNVIDSKNASLSSTTFGVSVTIVTQILNYYMTGIAPHRSSEYGNLKQNSIEGLNNRFLAMSVELLKLYHFDKELGSSIANKVSVLSLKTEMSRLLANQDVDHVVKPFEESLGYIKRGIVPHNLMLHFLVRVHEIEAKSFSQKNNSYENGALSSQDILADQFLNAYALGTLPYFPDGESSTAQLVYLSCLKKDGEVLTEEEVKLFESVNKVRKIADSFLWPVFWATTSALAVSGIVAVATTFSDDKWYAFESNIAALLASLGTQISGYYYTGIIPHRVSCYSNTAQDYKKIIADRFESLALALKGLGKNARERIPINLPVIKRILENSMDPLDVENVLEPLKEIALSKLNGEFPRIPLLYLDRKIELIESAQLDELDEVIVL